MKKFMSFLVVFVLLGTSVFAATELSDPIMINNIGFYAYEQGNVQLAESLFRKAIALDEDYAKARENLAVLLNGLERYDEAAEQLEVLTQLDQGNTQYWYDLGVNYIADFRFGSQDLAHFYKGLAAYESAASIDDSYAHVQENIVVLNTIKEKFGL